MDKSLPQITNGVSLTDTDRLRAELFILLASRTDRYALQILERFQFRDDREAITRRALDAARRLGIFERWWPTALPAFGPSGGSRESSAEDSIPFGKNDGPSTNFAEGDRDSTQFAEGDEGDVRQETLSQPSSPESKVLRIVSREEKEVEEAEHVQSSRAGTLYRLLKQGTSEPSPMPTLYG